MKKSLTIVLTFLTLTIFSQNFEGKIAYQNTYVSKIPNITSEQFVTMMGSTQNYIIKEGNYKSNVNRTMFQWQIYNNKENKLYTKVSNLETILWNDVAVNNDTVLKVELNKNITEVLGYKCDEVILTCKSGLQKYYYNSKFGVDISFFVKHLYGNWYDYLKEAKALPLKIITDNAQFTLTTVATEVKEMKLDDKEFQLPENSKTTKSPF
jgi:hypothetical protein